MFRMKHTKLTNTSCSESCSSCWRGNERRGGGRLNNENQPLFTQGQAKEFRLGLLRGEVFLIAEQGRNPSCLRTGVKYWLLANINASLLCAARENSMSFLENSLLHNEVMNDNGHTEFCKTSTCPSVAWIRWRKEVHSEVSDWESLIHYCTYGRT